MFKHCGEIKVGFCNIMLKFETKIVFIIDQSSQKKLRFSILVFFVSWEQTNLLDMGI